MSTRSSDHPQFDHYINSLTSSLDTNTQLRVYHVSTPPVSTTPIFAAPPGQPDESTTCESHFLTISQPHVITSATSDDPPTNQDNLGRTANHVLILGIEVLIFSTGSSTTIFVSKADSTGLLSRSTSAGSKQGSPSVVKTVISTFLQWLVAWQLSLPRSGSADVTDASQVGPVDGHVYEEISTPSGSGQIGSRRRPRRLVLSLFARSQNQYLFPGSVENSTKHVLDDRQLIKWWCRLLDELVQKKDWTTKKVASRDTAKVSQQDCENASEPPSTANNKLSAAAYVVVPGCDRSDIIRSFFPPSARYPQDGTSVSKWHNSYPVDSLAPRNQSSSQEVAATSLPVRCLIPRLPDDPKARYCDDLDHAGIDSNGQWRDIRSLQQFWETMEYRQECAAGRLVGFVWVVFDTDQNALDDCDEVNDHANETVRVSVLDAPQTAKVATESKVPNGTFDRIPPTQTGSTVVTNELYITLSDLLINDTDFAGAELAVKSTQEWIDKVKELCSLQSFGTDVQGRKALPASTSAPVDTSEKTKAVAGIKHPRDEAGAPVNLLTGVRKKKQKVVSETAAEGSGDHSQKILNGEHGNGVNLGEETTKELDHIETQVGDDSTASEGVKTLSAGLVRKKQKAPAPVTVDAS